MSRIKIPETVDEIQANAFYHCTALEEVLIPEGAAFSRDDVFKPCVRLLG
ncbi:MAG: leucine-rich repeat protein [Candidatus Limivicinus sp.]